MMVIDLEQLMNGGTWFGAMIDKVEKKNLHNFVNIVGKSKTIHIIKDGRGGLGWVQIYAGTG